MPFAVFRRHQRKLLAVFAILAMFGFVVADSLPRLLSGGPSRGANPVVVTLYGRSVRQSDLDLMKLERSNANFFMAEVTRQATRGLRVQPQFFGDLNNGSMVDALILQHEADRLGMPRGPEVAKDWLRERAPNLMTKTLFEQILSHFNNRVSGEQLLSEVANQIRLMKVRMLLAAPVVTPLDVFSAYRDQNERVSARAVGYRVEDFLSKISEPSAAQTQAHYDKYKDVLPDPERPTPGFKVPRQVQVEVLSIDGEALRRGIEAKLTEAELLSYYENRKAEFRHPSELPEQIFAGDDKNELTPPLTRSFAEMRPYLATSLADERAQADVGNRFEKIKADVMIPVRRQIPRGARGGGGSEEAWLQDQARAPDAGRPQDGRRDGGPRTRDHAAALPRPG
jgi:peptidyl-prolyl cis-trans isomerase D